MQVEVSKYTEGAKEKARRPNGLPKSLIRYDGKSMFSQSTMYLFDLSSTNADFVSELWFLTVELLAMECQQRGRKTRQRSPSRS